jgi:indolepyruvate ferredoxin oxidoreductase alpha subunit
VCGDSTFFHTSVPALINAVHTGSRMLMIVLDNKGTAMTGFQPHPGLAVDAVGQPAPSVEIEKLCAAIGAGVTVRDPFELSSTVQTINDLLEKGEGVQVLVLRQACALSPERKGKKAWNVRIDEAACMGERCGCNRLCTRIFRCPGLVWDAAAGKARIDEVVCTGCGMCSLVCPAGAILREVR